jgi:hypothetical protein
MRLTPEREKEIRLTLKAFKHYREAAHLSYAEEPAADIEALLEELDAVRTQYQLLCESNSVFGEEEV